MLFPGEKIFDANNCQELIGNGKFVMAGGDKRLLSRIKPPEGYSAGFPKFEDHFDMIPQKEWKDRLQNQLEQQACISDWQNFPPHDQNGLPTCWANGPAHALTTQRVMQGLPYKELSANSAAVPISGGNSGGWEAEALKLFVDRGAVSCELWPNNSRDRSLDSDPKCEEDRKHHRALEWYDLGSNEEAYATACLLGFPMAVAYNWWSHVVSLSDLVDEGGWNFRIRNNWGDWGAKNRFGFPGYQVLKFGHGTPSSGFCVRQVTASAA